MNTLARRASHGVAIVDCQLLPPAGCYLPGMSEPVRVRRQPLLAVPGWLLFVCLFLPTLRVCGDPTMPVQFPPSYAVYLGAAMIAISATATLLATRQRVFTIWIALWSITALGIVAAIIGSEVEAAGLVAAVVFFGFQIWMLMALWRVSWSPRAIAIGCTLHAVAAVIWNSLLSFDPDGMFGAHLALAASVLLLGASIVALRSAHGDLVRHRRETEPAPLPTARALVRD